MGSSGVGKTTLVRSFVAGRYAPATEPTYGVDFCTAGRFQLWDTAGLPSRATVDVAMVRDAAVVVLAFADARSFVAIQTHWLPLVKRCAPASARLVLASLQTIDDECDDVHAAYARSIGATYAIVAAESTTSVARFFHML